MIESLTQHPDIEEWSILNNVEIPSLESTYKVIFMDISEDEHPDEFEVAFKNLLTMTKERLQEANDYIFSYYRNFVTHVGEGEFEFSISSSNEIWNYISISEITISRRPYGNKAVYVSLLGGCEWEEEHGLQIVLKNGKTISRVSDQDGHLTWSDAYDDPKLENVIYHEI